MKSVYRDQLAAQLASMTSTSQEDWFFVTKARYGLEVIFRVIAGLKGRGQVLTQPFTCATAVNPILVAGLEPRFIDISAEDLSIDTSKLQADAQTRAIVVQHSFGIRANALAAQKFASEHEIVLVEDSAHACGLMARGSDKQPLADVSVHSFGVEKMLSTKFGGAVWVNPKLDPELRQALVKTLKSLPVIDRSMERRIRHYKTLNRILSHLHTAFRRIATMVGLFEPAVHPKELNGKNHGRASQPSDLVLEKIITELKNYPENLRDRAAVARLYHAELSDILKMPQQLARTKAPVRYPLICQSGKQAEDLFDHLNGQGYYVGKWYRPTLFPGVKNPAVYNYDKDTCPVAEDLSARILNLPTNVTLETAKEIANVIRSKIVQ